MKKMKEDIKNNPMMTIFFLIVSTTVTMLGTTTFATMNYVDKKYSESKTYTEGRYNIIKNDVDSKHSEVRSDLKDVKTELRNLNNNILKLRQGR